jgi:hypothetical protein
LNNLLFSVYVAVLHKDAAVTDHSVDAFAVGGIDPVGE